MDTCSICMDTISGKETVVCENEHTFHPTCAARWFQTQLNRKCEMTCPTCRAPTTSWKYTEVKTVRGKVMKMAVTRTQTISDLKELLSWMLAFPPKSMKIHVATSTTLLENKIRVTRFQLLHLKLHATSGEHCILMDLPRSASADSKFKCKLSNALLLNPIKGADGLVYEMAAVTDWIRKRGNVSVLDVKIPILPLTPFTDEEFLTAVRAIKPDPTPVMTEVTDEEITIKLKCPLIEPFPVVVKRSDTIASLVARVTGKVSVVMDANGIAFEPTNQASLAQAGVGNGDLVYMRC
jgi:hypothetical protein